MDTTTSTLSRLEQNLAEITALKQLLKERTMIYQYEDKIECARFFGINPAYMFELSYTTWCKVGLVYRQVKESAYSAYERGELPELGNNPLMGEIWAAWYHKQIKRY